MCDEVISLVVYNFSIGVDRLYCNHKCELIRTYVYELLLSIKEDEEQAWQTMAIAR